MRGQLACRNLVVAVDGDLSAGSVVAADVTCTVELGDVTLVGSERPAP